jgi:uncharacterized protein YkwD
MKRNPDKPSPYYFASLVYREKSKTHLEMKTRYMMMMKSIGYAMKLENLEDHDLEIKVNWEDYLDDLQIATVDLIGELGETELANFGERLSIKHQKMEDNREVILVVSNDNNAGQVTIPAEEETEALTASIEEESSMPSVDNYSDKGYFGLAHGNETPQSFNRIQEQELLRLINEEREQLFMSDLKVDNNLYRAALYHAHDMASQDYFFHDSFDRINGELIFIADTDKRVGQFSSSRNKFAQNIAGGNLNAHLVFQQWLSSEEASEILFNESAKKVGIGLCYDPESTHGYYWVLVTSSKH